MMSGMVPSMMQAAMHGFMPAFPQRLLCAPSTTPTNLDEVGRGPGRRSSTGSCRKSSVGSGSGSGSGSRSSSSSSSSSASQRKHKKNIPVYDLSMKAKITGSATYLHGLPKSRRGQLVETIDKRFDAALLADLSNEDLSKLLWLQSKVKPNAKLSDLRVRRYSDLSELLRRAAERVSGASDADLYTLVTSGDQISIGLLSQVAERRGWRDDFLKLTKKDARSPASGAAPSDIGLEPGQMQLHQFRGVAIHRPQQPQQLQQPQQQQQLQQSELQQPQESQQPHQPARLQGPPVQRQAQQVHLYELAFDCMTHCYKLFKADGTWSWVSAPREKVELLQEGNRYFLQYGTGVKVNCDLVHAQQSNMQQRLAIAPPIAVAAQPAAEAARPAATRAADEQLSTQAAAGLLALAAPANGAAEAEESPTCVICMQRLSEAEPVQDQ